MRSGTYGDRVKVFIVLSAGAFCFYFTGCGRRSPQPSSENTLSNTDTAVTVDITNEIPEIQVLEEFNDESVSAEESVVVSVEVDSEVFIPPAPQQIQAALKNAGYYNASIDGKIGPKSQQAIRNFQRDNQLVVDGKVGPKTWSRLKKHLDQ